MRMTYLSDERARGEFAERAAARFAANPRISTYTDGEIEPDALFAVRWGLHDRAVLVFKVGDMAPIIYMDLVPRDVAPFDPLADKPF